MAEQFGLRERLIAIARANNLADRPRARGPSCRLEELLAQAAMSAKIRITDRGISNIFKGKSGNPRDRSIDAINELLKQPFIKKRPPENWVSLDRRDLLSALGLPVDTKLEFEIPSTTTVRPFHAVAKLAFQRLRSKIEDKYGGIYSVYRRHAREHAKTVVEDALWIGFLSNADLPQAILFTKEGWLIGEVTPGSSAWSISFIASREDELDKIGNDALRIERRDVDRLPAFNGIRMRHSRSGANVAYRTILVGHPRDALATRTNPAFEELKERCALFVREHEEGSEVQGFMFDLLEQDGANQGDSESGVMHSRDLDIELHLKGFDPTKSRASEV
ncbi:MAG: hypothetical protein FD124_1159 [Alphaproteobacteria bacterium]|nr:MAG: hypothetical protein FD160_1841 [Caulobacteraceae bacterium]TPW07407.1 MAG: hypothetical protein FD124_1159 [Alphaproteobacteria bacterium]